MTRALRSSAKVPWDVLVAIIAALIVSFLLGAVFGQVARWVFR